LIFRGTAMKLIPSPSAGKTANPLVAAFRQIPARCSMSKPIHAFQFLSKPTASVSVGVVFGDDRFLKRMVLDRLRAVVQGAEEDLPSVVLDGNSAAWRDVADEVATVSLFGGDRRFVVVESADKFVTAARSQLEEYVQRPSRASVLVLDVSRWPGNTRLYQAVAKTGLAIDCGPPQRVVGKRSEVDQAQLTQWLCRRAVDPHRVTMTQPAAAQLIELVGHDLGMLDQQLAKLAVLVSSGEQVTPEGVCEIIGGWQTKTTWDLLDAATEGRADEALKQLDRILQSGEPPQQLFGAISWSLRRFADATRVVQRAERQGRPVNLTGALVEAGFRQWPRNALVQAERQLRQIGRHRASQLHQWLLAADLALKSTHSDPNRARFVMEQLIVRLARQNRPAVGG
jgi:DNA polymerase-3 subunit delta